MAKKKAPGMGSRARETQTDAAGLGERSRLPEIAPDTAPEYVTPASTGNAPGEVEEREGAACERSACGCLEADVTREGRRYCGEACADAAASAAEEAEGCACGHAGCGAGARAGRDEGSRVGRTP